MCGATWLRFNLFSTACSFTFNLSENPASNFHAGKQMLSKVKWTKDQVLSDSVWIFIQNKSSSTVSQHWDQKEGNAKTAFHSLALHSILSSELSLWFCFCAFASVVNTTYTKHWQRCRDRCWSSSAEAVFTRVHHTIEHSNSCRFVRLRSIKVFFRLTRKIQVLKLTGRFYITITCQKIKRI